MVCHNNTVFSTHRPKMHGPKMLGMYRVRLDQAGRKVSRRHARQEKATKMAPRPVDALRPAVHCMTQRYNMRMRMGRGFSVAELKAAGVAPAYAKTIGICVDTRRKNRSEESLNRNVERIKAYVAKITVKK
ncbi:Ribosomal protein L13e [Carpediemonas membranifera]|uniref:60S ribosomal protein L13 n=1 Tax=Carpediemonas membranifera TaxID=201153 RepID=A0A8J6E3I6_9EUKA|nr:Ribosomal protein L13e [Carpediemonas membranifera]|eukprot:KAG9393232.1 Ribosomal protein L13e [Carpediemonas membranifera]